MKKTRSTKSFSVLKSKESYALDFQHTEKNETETEIDFENLKKFIKNQIYKSYDKFYKENILSFPIVVDSSVKDDILWSFLMDPLEISPQIEYINIISSYLFSFYRSELSHYTMKGKFDNITIPVYPNESNDYTNLKKLLLKNKLKTLIPLIDEMSDTVKKSNIDHELIKNLIYSTDIDYEKISKKNIPLAKLLKNLHGKFKDIKIFSDYQDLNKVKTLIDQSKNMVQTYIELNEILEKEKIKPIKKSDIKEVDTINGKRIYSIDI